MRRVGYTEHVPAPQTREHVPPSLVRCAAAILVIGVFVPGAMEGLAQLVLGLTRLSYGAPLRPVNGFPDVLRQAVIDGADWRVIGIGSLRYGPRFLLVVFGVLLLRGRGPLMAIFRRLR